MSKSRRKIRFEREGDVRRKKPGRERRRSVKRKLYTIMFLADVVEESQDLLESVE